MPLSGRNFLQSFSFFFGHVVFSFLLIPLKAFTPASKALKHPPHGPGIALLHRPLIRYTMFAEKSTSGLYGRLLWDII